MQRHVEPNGYILRLDQIHNFIGLLQIEESQAYTILPVTFGLSPNTFL